MPETLERTAETAAPEEGAQEQKPAKRPKVRGRLPEKRTINLATVNVKRINWRVALPSVLAILLACAAFGKFAVWDRINDVAVAQNEVVELQEKLEKSYAAMEAYGEINDVYAHYTYSGMTDEERGRADRIAAMDMIERVVLPNTSIDDWKISGNQLELDLSAGTLQEINMVVQRLLAEDIVDFCTVSTAGTADTRNYSAPEDEQQEGTKVSANVLVQLKSAQQREG